MDSEDSTLEPVKFYTRFNVKFNALIVKVKIGSSVSEKVFSLIFKIYMGYNMNTINCGFIYSFIS